MAEHNLLGNKGEMLASRYLMEQGFAVLRYNWRCGHKEIDLIARERDTLVFVEIQSFVTHYSYAFCILEKCGYILKLYPRNGEIWYNTQIV